MKERQINTMMSSRASALLRKASGGFEPSLADKTKTRAAIARRLAVGVAAGAAVAVAAKSAAAKSAAAAPSFAPAALPALAAAPTASAAPAAATAVGVGFATKLVAVVAIVGTVSAGAVGVHRATQNANRVSNAIATTSTTKAPAVAMPLVVAPVVQQSASQEAPVQQTAVSSPADIAPAVAAPIANSLRNKPVQKIDGSSPKIKTTPPLQAGAENELFQRAELAFNAGDATTALALLDDHAERFPNGQLVEDCDALRVLALCSAGRQIEAASKAAAFLSAYPNSTSAGRVRSSCANGSSE